MFYLQYHRRILRHIALRLRVLIDHTSYHHVDDIVLRALLRDQRSYVPSVPHNSHTVCDHLDLIHTMGNIYDSQLSVPQVPDNFEQFLDLRFRQRC